MVSGPKTLQTSIGTRYTIHVLVISVSHVSTATEPTSFCAEKIEFMNGMYGVDASGDADNMRMRESTATLLDSEGLSLGSC